MISGAENRVQVLVAAVPDFLIMKAHALAGRDKPKDAYDLCFCLDNAPGGIEALARAWRERRDSPLVNAAIEHLRVVRDGGLLRATAGRPLSRGDHARGAGDARPSGLRARGSIS
jgi:hypothetical protein